MCSEMQVGTRVWFVLKNRDGASVVTRKHKFSGVIERKWKDSYKIRVGKRSKLSHLGEIRVDHDCVSPYSRPKVDATTKKVALETLRLWAEEKHM